MRLLGFIPMFVVIVAGICVADPMEGALVDAEPKKCPGCRVADAVRGTLSEVVSSVGNAADPDSPARVREKIDEAEGSALKKLFNNEKSARELYAKAFGYGVFASRKFSSLPGSVDAAGVVHELPSGKRTYMQMEMSGFSASLRRQKYQLVVFFEDEVALESFKEGKWSRGEGAENTAPKDSNKEGEAFVDGVAIFRIKDSEIQATANLKGARFKIFDQLHSQG